MSNPFVRYDATLGMETGAVDAESRKRAVEGFDLEQCRAALEVPGLQKAVEAKCWSRIRKLLNNPRMEP